MQCPLASPDGVAHSAPFLGPRAGARGRGWGPREWGERDPRRFPGLGNREPESAGEGWWPPAEIGFDIPAWSRPSSRASAPAALHQKAFGSPAGFCFCSARNSSESREKPEWAVAPAGGRGCSPRCGPEVPFGGGDRFPPGWGMDPYG
ncbi:hypothetical protein HJG60_008304 [Phyllostomus discolor]|uniref:Uncharacterized protein n=1 Tax=Phyllostomus discolor TaxID=89673 RepID=A0A833Z6W3_9CHIR|nr:hypothetical protein HJG60_008304 [Phyllostomus discolor]